MLVGALVAPLLPAPAAAAAEQPGRPAQAAAGLEVLDAPGAAPRGVPVTVAARLVGDAGAAVADVQVLLERAAGGAAPDAQTVWTEVGRGRTGAEGTVAVTFTPAGSNLYRFRTVGAAVEAVSPVFPILTTAAASTVALEGPARTRADRRIVLTATWRSVDGRPVVGPVRLQQRSRGAWRTLRTVPSRPNGTARFALVPVEDAVLRVATAAGDVASAATSRALALEVTPAYAVVEDLPGAPAATALPPQPRATTPGSDVRITPVPDGVWREMVGRSWHPGCPVGRSGLSLLTLNYIGFDGYRHRGEIVVARRVAPRVATVFARMYAARYPLRSLRRVDGFGWSRVLRGADDYASMAADNTSGFNCRQVVGNSRARSPHAYGTAIDVNPLENPYVARNGSWPSAFYVDRGRSHPAVLRAGSPVVRAFARIGWRWGAAYRDWQHFDTARGYD